jgi:hypothetical protein
MSFTWKQISLLTEEEFFAQQSQQADLDLSIVTGPPEKSRFMVKDLEKADWPKTREHLDERHYVSQAFYHFRKKNDKCVENPLFHMLDKKIRPVNLTVSIIVDFVIDPSVLTEEERKAGKEFFRGVPFLPEELRFILLKIDKSKNEESEFYLEVQRVALS